MRPAETLAGGGDFLGAQRRAMHVVAALLAGRARIDRQPHRAHLARLLATAAPRVVGPDPADQATRAMTTPVRRRSVATTQGHPVMTNLDRPTASGARRVPARRRGFPWAWFLAAAVIVGLLTAVVMMLLNGREDEPEGPVQTVTTTTDGGTSEESQSGSDASGSASESESDSGNSETATDPESSDAATTDPVVPPPTTSQDDPSTSEADPTTSEPLMAPGMRDIIYRDFDRTFDI